MDSGVVEVCTLPLTTRCLVVKEDKDRTILELLQVLAMIRLDQAMGHLTFEEDHVSLEAVAEALEGIRSVALEVATLFKLLQPIGNRHNDGNEWMIDENH